MSIPMRMLAGLVLLVIGVTPFQSRAEMLQPMDLYLVMTMGGVTAGSLKLSIDPQGNHIDSRLKMKSQGLFKFLTGYKSTAEGQSTPAINGRGPMPVSYDSTYETNNSERKVQIRYDAGDGQITELKAWKSGKLRRSKVPEDLWQETVDPLTAVLQLRHWVRDLRAAKAGETVAGGLVATDPRRFEVFDGRRRYQLKAEFLDHRNIRFDGRNEPAFRFKVQMAPLAGFGSNDMLANWASEDGQRWIELVITDDDNPLPVVLKTRGGSLQTTVYLRKVCMGDAGCNKVSG